MHENLNGKHIKNRIGNNRTIFFPDGTKITSVSTGLEESVTAISIHDGDKAHHLNITCDKVEYSTANSEIAKRLDDQQLSFFHPNALCVSSVPLPDSNQHSVILIIN